MAAFYIRYHNQARIQACKLSALLVSFNLGITAVTIMAIMGHEEHGSGAELARTEVLTATMLLMIELTIAAEVSLAVKMVPLVPGVEWELVMLVF